MPVLMFFVVLILGNGLLLTSTAAFGWLIHWVFPEVEMGTCLIIAFLATCLTAYLLVRSFWTLAEDGDGDSSEDEDADAVEAIKTLVVEGRKVPHVYPLSKSKKRRRPR